MPPKCPMGHNDCEQMRTKVNLICAGIGIIAVSALGMLFSAFKTSNSLGQWQGKVDTKLESIEVTNTKQSRDIENLGWVINHPVGGTKL